jgi:hypothetical protein
MAQSCDGNPTCPICYGQPLLNPDVDVSFTGYGGTCMDVELLLQDSWFYGKDCNSIHETIFLDCCVERYDEPYNGNSNRTD